MQISRPQFFTDDVSVSYDRRQVVSRDCSTSESANFETDSNHDSDDKCPATTPTCMEE